MSFRRILQSTFFLFFIFNITCSGSTVESVKVAFLGDQGLGEDSVLVLQLVADENADAVIHLGDFDYVDDPAAWDDQINGVLGEGFPYFSVIGNHDRAAWETTESLTGYQDTISNRLESLADATCSGDVGLDSVCEFKGVTFVFSGIGTLGNDADHLVYLENQLASSTTVWKVCAWHKNHRLMQVGDKSTEVVMAAYDLCRSYGAIIATGHEHSYARTHLLSSFENQTVVSSESDLVLSEGQSFAFVSGLGGRPVRAQNDELAANTWWGAVYTATQNATHGALFCEFNANGQLGQGECYFKNVDGERVDEFSLSSSLSFE